MKILLTLALLLLVATAPAFAAGPVIRPSNCGINNGSGWDAPQLNNDGSNLTNLKEYRLYISTEQVDVTTVTTPFLVIPAPEADPPAGKRMFLAVGWCRGLPVGQMYAQVEAVTLSGAVSARTAPYPFVSALDVLPLAPTNFQLAPVGP